jgi:AraC-like DNA-binding protein
MHDLLERMRHRVLRHADETRLETALPRVSFAVTHSDTGPEFMLRGPGVCLVLQGSKHVVIGDRQLQQGLGNTFAAITELPVTRYMFRTSQGAPYVATGIKLDPERCLELLADLPPEPKNGAVPCFSVGACTPALLEAWDRLLALLDEPADIPALAPARERELLYRLLQGQHGPLLRQIGREEHGAAQIRRVIDFIRTNFDQPLPVPTLADIAGMSVPAFNRRFRSATATSPRQFQKTIQLHAARELLLSDNDVSCTAYAVGYRSASQFSREYSRLFGRPPRQDALAMGASHIR